MVVPIVNPDGYEVCSGDIAFFKKYYIFGNSILGPPIVCGERTEENRVFVHVKKLWVTRSGGVMELI